MRNLTAKPINMSFTTNDADILLGSDLTEPMSPSASLRGLMSSNTSDLMKADVVDDIDQLLSALQQASDPKLDEVDTGLTGDRDLPLKTVDGSEFGISDQGPNHDASVVSLNTDAIEPLSLDDLPSDPNLLFNLNESELQEFQENSMKLDEFMNRSSHNTAAPYTATQVHNEPIAEEPMPPEPVTKEQFIQPSSGKRRRAPRRGSLPTMHLTYDSPHQAPMSPSPTPISPMEERQTFQMNSYYPNYRQVYQEPNSRYAAQSTNYRGGAPGHAQQVRQQGVAATRQGLTSNTETSYSQPTRSQYGIEIEDGQLDHSGSLPIQPEKRRRAQRRGSLPTMHLNYATPVPIRPAAPSQTISRMTAQQPPAEETVVVHGRTASYKSQATYTMTLKGSDDEDQPPKRMERSDSFDGMDPFGFRSGGLSGDSKINSNTGGFNLGSMGTKKKSQRRRFGVDGPRRLSRPSSTDGLLCSPRLSMMSSGGSNATFDDINKGDTAEGIVEPESLMLRLRQSMTKSAETQRALQNWDRQNGLPKSHSQTMVNSSRSRKQLQDGVILPKWDGTPLINNETELGKPRARGKNGKMQRRMSAPATSMAW